MTTIYVDLLFCTNLIINYFIILVTAKLNRVPIHRFRYILGASVGALYSLFIFIPSVDTLVSVLSKCVFSVSIVLISFGRQNRKSFFRILSSFFGVTFGLCGIMFACFIFLKPKNMIMENGITYFNISASSMILFTVAFYIIFEIINIVSRRKAKGEMYCKIEVVTEMGSVLLNGLVDSGNTLCDLFTDSPVIVVAFDSISAVIPGEYRRAFKDASLDSSKNLDKRWAARYRLIPYSSVKGTGLLPAFRPKSLYIYYENKSIKIPDILVAVSENMKSEEKAVINPRVMELSETEGLKCLKK